MGGITDPNKLTEDLATGYNLAKKYVAYEDASEERKKRIEARDENKQKRYAASKARLEAKRERYADKMVGKGLIEDREAAMNRFDSLRNITTRSAANRDKILDNFAGNKKESEEIEETQVVDPEMTTPNFRYNTKLA